jgi:WD40 repeat protein
VVRQRYLLAKQHFVRQHYDCRFKIGCSKPYQGHLPMIRARFLPLAVLFCILAACAAPGAPTTPATPEVATAVPSLPTTVAARLTVAPTAQLSPTPITAAANSPIPTAIATLAATAAPNGLAPPTATPSFPTLAIEERALSALRPLRVLGVGKAQALALAPDGTLLAVGTSAGVALFELPSMHQARFDPVEDGVERVAFSPDGRMLALGGADGRTALQRVADGAILRVLQGVGPVFSPDGRTIATTLLNGDTSSIALWRAGDGAQLATVAGADPLFSANGRLVATVQRTLNQQDSIALWSAADGAPIWTVPGSVPAFSPDGQLLAVATHDTIQLLRLADNQSAGTLATGVAPTIFALAFSPDSRLLRVLVGGELQVWNIADGRLARSLPDPHGEGLAQGGSFGPSGGLLSVAYSFGDGGLVRLVRTDDGGTIYESEWAAGLAFSADGATAAVLHLDIAGGGEVHVLGTARAGDARIALPAYQNITFSPDAQTLAASTGYAVELRRATDSALQRTLEVGDEPIGEPFSVLRFSPDGATLSLAGTFQIYYGDTSPVAASWNLRAGDKTAWKRSLVPTLQPGAWTVGPAGASATAQNGDIEIHPTGGVTLTLTLPVTVTALAISPDGVLLAAADERGAVHLIKIDDGATVGVLEAGGPIDPAANLVSFSPDGALLGALRTDGVIVVWRLDSRQPLAKLAARPDDRRLIFTADGQMAITSGPRGVAFYRLSDGALLRALPIAAEDIAIGPRRRLLALLHGGQIQLWGI